MNTKRIIEVLKMTLQDEKIGTRKQAISLAIQKFTNNLPCETCDGCNEKRCAFTEGHERGQREILQPIREALKPFLMTKEYSEHDTTGTKCWCNPKVIKVKSRRI